MFTMLVRDMMTTTVVTATPETPLKEVARRMVERAVSGIPVVEADGRVIGVVSEADFLVKERGAEAIHRRPLAWLFGESRATRHAIEKVEATATPDGIRVRFEADMLFDPNTADLRPASKDLVAAISTIIEAYPESTVKVSAFSDSSGDEKANLRLTDDRAAALKEALRAMHLPQGVTLESRGYGRSRPIGSNTTEQGRAKNRRAEVLIKP